MNFRRKQKHLKRNSFKKGKIISCKEKTKEFVFLGNRLQNNYNTMKNNLREYEKGERKNLKHFFFISQCFKKKSDRNIKSCTCNRITAQRIMTNISTFFFFFLSLASQTIRNKYRLCYCIKKQASKKKLILKNASKRDGRHLCALMFIETRSIGISMGFFFRSNFMK